MKLYFAAVFMLLSVTTYSQAKWSVGSIKKNDSALQVHIESVALPRHNVSVPLDKRDIPRYIEFNFNVNGDTLPHKVIDYNYCNALMEAKRGFVCKQFTCFVFDIPIVKDPIVCNIRYYYGKGSMGRTQLIIKP